MALHKSTGNYNLGHLSEEYSLVTGGQIVDVDAGDPTVQALVVEGKLLPASEDGQFPERSAVMIRRCCGGGWG